MLSLDAFSRNMKEVRLEKSIRLVIYASMRSRWPEGFSCPEEIAALLERCLAEDPDARPSAAEAMQVIEDCKN